MRSVCCTLSLAFLLPALAAAPPARAEIYTWVDEHGTVHYSDVPPAEADSSSVRVEQDEAAHSPPRADANTPRAYDAAEPSRIVLLEKVVVHGRNRSEEPIVIGPKCGGGRHTMQDAMYWAKSIRFDSGFHGRLDELGYRTLATASALSFRNEPTESPDLSVIAEITGLRLRTCRRIADLEVGWRVFDNLRRKVVLERETRGSDRLNLSRSVKHSMLEAFVDAANELFLDREFVALATPAAPAEIDRGALDIEPISLRIYFGDRDASFTEKVAALKAGSATVRTKAGHGSGFVLSAAGHVITNAHVVGASRKAVVVLAGQEIDARVVRQDRVRDVALLELERIPAAAPLEISRGRPTEGDTLFVIGTPLSEKLSHTITRGILSAVREIEDLEYYQTDAPVNRGNSGGPAFNDRGEVVGITVSGMLTKGGATLDIGYLIPIEAALAALHISPAP